MSKHFNPQYEIVINELIVYSVSEIKNIDLAILLNNRWSNTLLGINKTEEKSKDESDKVSLQYENNREISTNFLTITYNEMGLCIYDFKENIKNLVLSANNAVPTEYTPITLDEEARINDFPLLFTLKLHSFPGGDEVFKFLNYQLQVNFNNDKVLFKRTLLAIKGHAKNGYKDLDYVEVLKKHWSQVKDWLKTMKSLEQGKISGPNKISVIKKTLVLHAIGLFEFAQNEHSLSTPKDIAKYLAPYIHLKPNETQIDSIRKYCSSMMSNTDYTANGGFTGDQTFAIKMKNLRDNGELKKHYEVLVEKQPFYLEDGFWTEFG